MRLNAAGPPPRRGAFESHLREAIALNRERAPRYAALSAGASRPISRQLVAAECLLLPVARWFDRRAAPYHAAGLPFLDALFLPMADAPAFAEHRPPPSGSGRPRSSPGDIRQRIVAAFHVESFAGAARAIAGELAAPEAATDRPALLHHLLESAHRLCGLAPELINGAEARGLRSPRRLLSLLLHLHLRGLAPAAALDRRALPLQRRGIAILTQDLPPIPPWGTFSG